MRILNKFIKSYNEREIKKLEKIANKIEKLEEKIALLSDSQLQEKTLEFKNQLKNGKSLDSILPEAFAVVREASKRVLNMRHYHVQLIGGIVLHQGRIAEMKTGEGKTLVATLPAYLNALTGNKVYIVTVNEYLAKTQMLEMSKLYNFLGLSTACLLSSLTSDQKRLVYNCDVIYATNNELGFDYLRDNLATSKENVIQTKRDFAIIDEVDSILIDEARTPLIISGKAENNSSLYEKADRFVKTLKNENDYIVDLKSSTCLLTEKGIKKVEQYFKIKNFADKESIEIRHYVTNALKANYIMKENIDYLVRNNQVEIIDTFTGRVMEGRRYSDGLHQAIEAKENVKIKSESKTYATITLQNYFKMYKKISGMTGTAKTEEEEFKNIYHLDVIEVPTNKPVARKDRKDLVFKTKKAKNKAIIEEISKSYEKGQPVLVGTTSVKSSEELSQMLKQKGIKHNVLNAKYLDQEAEIISHAGEYKMVTIATNMAGRGTDIRLTETTKKLGGLKVIGTERQESRRIDNQLRGRSGRQGDVGESVFYISLEDDLMKRFSPEKTISLLEKFNFPENEAIESKMVTNAIENAQKIIEGNNFDIRRNLLGYDNVMNIQRDIIYKQREEVLNNYTIKENVEEMIKSIVEEKFDTFEENEKLIIYLDSIGIVDKSSINLDDFTKESLLQNSFSLYDNLQSKIGEDELRNLEKNILLKIVDMKWINHINDMEALKQGIGLRAYGQHNPIQEYQNEGSYLFNEMISEIKEEFLRVLFNISM